MESRGSESEARPQSLPAVARRSIGCDRGTPCSNCTFARLNCTHSAVASVRSATPKQRVLISAKYEQKIDDIARDIDGIKQTLKGLKLQHPGYDGEHTAKPSQLDKPNHLGALSNHGATEPQAERRRPVAISTYRGPQVSCDHSVHIIDFVKAVVADGGREIVGSEASDVLTSLEGLLQALTDPLAGQSSLAAMTGSREVNHQPSPPTMPPMETAVSVLRWAKAHRTHSRIVWLSEILPIDRFTEVCQKIYFTVDDYSEVDLILASGYLYYVFTEHAVVTGGQDYQEARQQCRANFENGLHGLPLLLPPSIEVVAALTLGTFNAVERSKATVAWTFISTAANLCHLLGYHRSPPSTTKIENPLKASQKALFWTVYRLEKGLALRFGRPTTIRDDEIVSDWALMPRAVRLGRIHGKIYDRLYGPVALFRSPAERGFDAEVMATELRTLIDETLAEMTSEKAVEKAEPDPMSVIYLQCDLCCQNSILALVLRAIPTDSPTGFSNDCLDVARSVFDIHQQCMEAIRTSKVDPSFVIRYISCWSADFASLERAIVKTPFVPFSIVFTNAVQRLDIDDLFRLDRFAVSLQIPLEEPSPTTSGIRTTAAHPYRLYHLLSRAARHYIDAISTAAWPSIATIPQASQADDRGHLALNDVSLDGGSDMDTEIFQSFASPSQDLSSWSDGNQQLMALLDDNIMF